MDLSQYIRSVFNFPKPGIEFRDITPLLEDPDAFHAAVDKLCDIFADQNVSKVCAAEARGFMFAAAMGYKMGWGMAPIRKPGKLPWETISHSYQLEYGSATLHIHKDAIRPGERVLLIDDLLATGGTAEAMVKLVEQLGGVVVGLGFVVELVDLHGRNLLGGHRVESLIQFKGD